MSEAEGPQPPVAAMESKWYPTPLAFQAASAEDIDVSEMGAGLGQPGEEKAP